MKKVLKILFLLIFSIIIISIGKTVSANSINKISMDIYVDNDGNAKVTEVWECSASQGTEVYHPYYNLGTSKITNLQVSEKGKSYTSLSSWKTSGSLSSKAYKCGINTISNGVELCWGISEYGKHTYTVTYNISNFVSSLTDSQMIYWTLIPYDFSTSIGNVYIKIHTDFKISQDIDVWGYGNYGGTCYVYDGYIEMQSDGRLSTSEYMTILVKFPTGTFNAANSIDKPFEYYFNMAEDGAQKYEHKSSTSPFAVIAAIIGSLWPFIFMIIMGLVASKVGSNKLGNFNFGTYGKKFNKDTPYFRDIPCDKDLFKAYYIAYQYGLVANKTDLLGAIILKWIKDSVVTMDKKEGGFIIKKENPTIIMNPENAAKLTDSFETKLFNMMHEASKDGILESKEFEKWCSRHYSKILDWFDDIIESQRNRLVSEGYITSEETKTLGIFTSKKYTATEKIRQEAEQIYGLKKYLLEYTLVPDRESIQVHLFEEYMVLAQMLGIAKKVAKEFKDLYPDIIEQSSFDNYDTIYFINTWSHSSVSAASAAKSRAESYSSGGGGFSSGGGGGGSFGGGRRRRRFPLNHTISYTSTFLVFI